MLSPISLKTAVEAPVFRIAAGDSNYFVLLFDPEGEHFDHIAVVEIFTVGGATPPNMHQSAHELFYVLHGEGIARCEGNSVALRKGSALLLRPGSEHVVENTGSGKLYTLTFMTPNEGFAELIRAGVAMQLDAEDRDVLGGAGMKPLGSAAATQWRVNDSLVDMTRPALPMRAVLIAATPKAVRLDLARSAMLVIDMQNDFCHAEGWLAHIGVDIDPARAAIAPLAALLPDLREAGVPIIWVNWGNRPDRLNLSPALLHVYNPSGEGIGIGDALPGHGAHVLEQGSWAACIVDDLAASPGDIQVSKYRMSGFWDTALDSILRNLGVQTLMFGGVNLDQCVMATLQDANFLGYDCLLLQDCAATTSPEFCTQATLYNIRQCFGFVSDSPALRAAMRVRAR